MDTLTPEPVAPSPTPPQAISETVSKKRRGRPRMRDEKSWFAAKMLMPPGTKSPRSVSNYEYLCRAMMFLDLAKDEHVELRWIFNLDAMMQATPHAWRPGILTELGRIKDLDDMRRIALEICELKPKTTREACAMIRKWRMARDGKAHKKADALELAKMLAKVVDDYCATHPGWNYNQIRNALDWVRPDDDAPDDEAHLAGP